MIVKVEMFLEIQNDCIDEIKKIENHAEYLLDLDSYPEIKSVYGVKVKEAMENNTNRIPLNNGRYKRIEQGEDEIIIYTGKDNGNNEIVENVENISGKDFITMLNIKNYSIFDDLIMFEGDIFEYLDDLNDLYERLTNYEGDSIFKCYQEDSNALVSVIDFLEKLKDIKIHHSS